MKVWRSDAPASSRLNLAGETRLVLDLRATALAANAVEGTAVLETAAITARQLSIAQREPTRRTGRRSRSGSVYRSASAAAFGQM